MVSVCLAVFNGEKYILKQIFSILEQLDLFDEVIVIDDCSTDSSISLLRSINDKRIRIFRNDLNVGPQLSFERALQLSSGDFIFFSDQDDIWNKNKVSKIVDVFKNCKCCSVVSDAKIIDKNDKIIMNSFFKKRKSGPGVLKNFTRNSYLGCCMAIDKRVKEWVLPFPKWITQHDEWIGLVCDFVDGVMFLNEPLTMYRRHDTNASSDGNLSICKVLINRNKMLLSLFYRLPFLIKLRLVNKIRSKS